MTDLESMRAALERVRPDIVINCAVVVSVDRCEQDPTRCRAVNVGGVETLLVAIRESGRAITFVQISSSEVFGRVNEGEYKIEGYVEDDEPRPVSLYQCTKHEAEKVLQNFARAHPKTLAHWHIARAGWLYGAGRATFVDQFFEKLQRDEPLEVIVNQWRSPTWTKDFVAGLLELLSSEYESGIYHIANEVERGEASTLDVVEEIALTLGLSRVRALLKLVSREDIFKIPRAPSNVLKNTKLPRLRGWREALRAYLGTIHKL